MSKTVAIMQPTYLPWSGYFELMDQADIFVFLDSVQFEKQSWQQRNRIRNGENSWLWLTVPVIQKISQPICHVHIVDESNWRKKQWKSIQQSYARCKYWDKYKSELEEIYLIKWKLLIDLNIRFILFFREAIGISTSTVRSSDFSVTGKKNTLLVNICKYLEADRYISPVGSADYLEESYFRDAGINLVYQKYNPVRYHQMFDSYISHLSILDLLLNEGPESLNIIRSGSGPYA